VAKRAAEKTWEKLAPTLLLKGGLCVPRPSTQEEPIATMWELLALGGKCWSNKA
jgi:hypothetical protein